MKSNQHRRVLAIDIGGSHVKMRLFSLRELREFESGPKLTPRQMVKHVQALTGDWTYDAVVTRAAGCSSWGSGPGLAPR